jgi:hypothetical protein
MRKDLFGFSDCLGKRWSLEYCQNLNLRRSEDLTQSYCPYGTAADPSEAEEIRFQARTAPPEKANR